MTNNDVLRRTRYAFDFGDDEMIAIFGLAEYKVTRAQVSDWLKRDEDPAFVPLDDRQLASFLNGLITKKRGRRDGPSPTPEASLNNNIILLKLKIALNLQAEGTLAMINSRELNLSKHELSAFFRKTTHRQYRPCMDQVLRNFMQGMQLEFRGAAAGDA